MPAIGSGAACTGGRRPKVSKGETAMGEGATVPRALWGFERRG
jgi:hypothetical protein